jgi:glutamyl-tRNA synthetase
MMLSKDGAKLSKRHGAVSVGEYREQGIPPSGLLNYLVRFGWSFGDEEVFSMPELIDKFDWARCNRSDGKFDPAKLAAINFEHLKQPELTSDDAYVQMLEPFLRARFGDVDEGKVRAVLGQIRPRAKTLREATDSLAFLFAAELELEEKAKTKFLNADKAQYLTPLRELLAGVADFRASVLEEQVKAWAERDGIPLGAVAQPARVALTGRSSSPGLFEVMELLGKQTTLARLDAGAKIAGIV